MGTSDRVLARRATLAVGALLATCLLWLWLGWRGGSAASPGAAGESAAPVAVAPSSPPEASAPDDAAGEGETTRAVLPDRDADEGDRDPRAGRAEDAIVGVVRGPQDRPIEGARVQVERSVGSSNGLLVLTYSRRQEPLGEARTDAGGRFRVPARPGCAHRLTVGAPGMGTARRRDVPAGAFVEIELAAAATLEGSVRLDDGTPLANGALRGWDRTSRAELFRGSTDGQGRFRFDQLPFAAARVDVTAASGAVPWYDVDLHPGRTTRLDVVVPVGVRVLGRVTAASSGEPIQGARVGLGWVMDGAVLTDADGRYEILHYAGVGHHDMAVEARGFGRAEADLAVPDGQDLRRDFQLLEACSARGRVVDAEGAGLAGVVVLVLGEDGGGGLDPAETRTDAQGWFAFDSLRRDLAHVLAFRHPGYAERVVDLVGPPPDGQAFVLEDVVLPAQAVLVGRVVDVDGEPWPGLTVTIEDRSPATLAVLEHARLPGYSRARFSRRVRCDDTGTFRATDLSAGPHRVTCKAPGSNRAVSADVELHAGERDESVQLVLARGAVLRGIVVDAAGEPVSGARVRLFRPGEQWSRLSTGTALDGTFTLRPDEVGPDGRVGLQVEQDTWSLAPGAPRLATVFVDGIDPGEDTLHRITLPLAVPLSGVVLEPDGTPSARAQVGLRLGDADPFEWNATVHADEEGRFTLWVAPHRVVTIEAQATRPDDADPGGTSTGAGDLREATYPSIDAGAEGRSGFVLQLQRVPPAADLEGSDAGDGGR